jgi:hypothetical protein
LSRNELRIAAVPVQQFRLLRHSTGRHAAAAALSAH